MKAKNDSRNTFLCFFWKNIKKLLGICWFCLVFFLKFYVVKNTSTDIFLCPKLFWNIEKVWDIENFCHIAKFQNNEGKNNRVRTFFYIQVFRWTQLTSKTFIFPILYYIICPARCDNKINNENQLEACAAASSHAESKNWSKYSPELSELTSITFDKKQNEIGRRVAQKDDLEDWSHEIKTSLKDLSACKHKKEKSNFLDPK